MKTKIQLFLLGLILLISTKGIQAEVQVSQFVDKDSGGWAYKKADEAFVADVESSGMRFITRQVSVIYG